MHTNKGDLVAVRRNVNLTHTFDSSRTPVAAQAGDQLPDVTLTEGQPNYGKGGPTTSHDMNHFPCMLRNPSRAQTALSIANAGSIQNVQILRGASVLTRHLLCQQL